MDSIKITALFVIAFFALSPQCFSQNIQKWGLEDNPYDRKAAAVLDVIASQSEEEAKQFIKKNFSDNFINKFSMEEHLAFFKSLMQDFPNVYVGDIYIPEVHKVTFVIRSQSTSKEAELTLALDSNNDEITGLDFHPIEAGTLLSFESIQDMEKKLREMEKKNRFSGVVMIVKDRLPIFANAYGYQNKEKGTVNQVDTKFDIGSIMKSFTRVAIEQLVEQDKIDLSDPINKYLPDFPSDVKIEHLINHTSGYGDFFESEYWQMNVSKIKTIDDYLSFMKNMKPEFEPGTNRKYSNTGYVLLGGIIEGISGLSYGEYLQEKIFKPAGMKNSGLYGLDNNVKNIALGYTNRNPNGPREGFIARNDFNRPATGTPAGYGYSTAEDLMNYFLALQNGKLLKENNRMQAGFAGGTAGVSAAVELLGKEEMVIVLSNYDEPIAEDIALAITEFLKEDSNANQSARPNIEIDTGGGQGSQTEIGGGSDPLAQKWGFPPSEHGKAISRFLEVISKNEDEYSKTTLNNILSNKFLNDFPIDKQLQMIGRMHSDFGNMRVTGVEVNAPGAPFHVTLNTQNAGNVTLIFRFNNLQKIDRVDVER